MRNWRSEEVREGEVEGRWFWKCSSDTWLPRAWPSSQTRLPRLSEIYPPAFAGPRAHVDISLCSQWW